MKKRVKKLELNRETLQKLEKAALDAVAGGGTSGRPCPSEATTCPLASCGRCPDEH